MSALAVGENPDTSAELGPSVTELLTMASDVVAMVNGRVESATVGLGIVSVHVASQADAEHLAWRPGLGQVEDYESNAHSHGFAVWSGGAWPAARFKVFCAGELVRPLRAFPRPQLHLLTDTTAVSGAA
jgi:hypothetical protein